MRWSAVVPFYNEREFIGRTIASLLAQTLPLDELVLVDNGSSDDSAAVCQRVVEGSRSRTATRIIEEPQPGQVHALEAGIRAARGEYIAVCDADTVYPGRYVETADRLFRQAGGRVAAVMAADPGGAPRGLRSRVKRHKIYLVSRLLPRQCHTGGYAMAFRRDRLQACGGYSAALWPWVLKDHELVHRLLKHGDTVYHPQHWCLASTRRSDRGAVRWTLTERLAYHLVPFAFKDWYFYRFLARRLARRGQQELVLRQRAWE
jgi:glycosyltransferase involved in cell wall biosynthesis